MDNSTKKALNKIILLLEKIIENEKEQERIFLELNVYKEKVMKTLGQYD